MNQSHHAAKHQGFSLIELIMVILILTLLIFVAYPSYQKYVRQAQIEKATAALSENARFMERFYSMNRSFKANSTSWPSLPQTQTEHFCIKFQGQARGVVGDRYTIKAVAFDTRREPRVILINQDHGIRICESSSSRCDNKATFSGSSGTDRNCSILH